MSYPARYRGPIYWANGERKNPVSSSYEVDVETNSFNRLSKAAINTRFEKGILLARLIVRDSPYTMYEEKYVMLSSALSPR